MKLPVHVRMQFPDKRMYDSMKTDPARIYRFIDVPYQGGAVAYWMSRDQRIEDNYALIRAQELAIEARSPLVIVFCLVPDFPGATTRHYDFMLRGLREAARKAATLNMPFFLLLGDPAVEIPRFVRRYDTGMLVTDFDPLRIKRRWKEQVKEGIAIPFEETDAHNIVPCRTASNKREYAAATIRKKIQRALPEFLTAIPPVKKHPVSFGSPLPEPDWEAAQRFISADTSVRPVEWLKPGSQAAFDTLACFMAERLQKYLLRNDPNADVLSNLSPYLHFGHISAHRVASEVMNSPDADSDNAASFLEELIIRRELSDNFCWYEPEYDSLAAAPDWAKRTLDEHRDDPRDYIYDRETFEQAKTHDHLWNAAQTEMTVTGKMHGYMRMYWAKKILEWSVSPEEALETALFLNDRYELDGRDPNGIVGCMWSIAGVHDRAWSERPVFGKIRYMSESGCRRKFDVERYIGEMEKLRNEHM